MNLHAIPGLAAALLLGACATNAPEPEHYWRSTTSADRAAFATDNASCSARATRRVPQGRADLLPGGATVMDNRIDRPPKRWVSSVADAAYMECMAEHGWHPVQR